MYNYIYLFLFFFFSAAYCRSLEMLPGNDRLLEPAPVQDFGRHGDILPGDCDGDPGPQPRPLPHLPPPPADQHRRPQVPGRQQQEDLPQHLIREQAADGVRFSWAGSAGTHRDELRSNNARQCKLCPGDSKE